MQDSRSPLGKFALPSFAAIASLLPFLIWLPKFRLLYWFHDDWELLDRWTRLGSSAWVRQPMGENFAPVFKLMWIGAIHLTGGSYLAMMILLWTTHLAILLLFAVLLMRCDFSKEAAAIAVLMLGLAWTNIETLGWATQWSAMLCTFFLMAGWVLAARNLGRWSAIFVVIAVLLSESTFARGILSGVVVAIFLLLSGRSRIYAALVFATSLILLLAYRQLIGTHPNFQHADLSRVAAMGSWAWGYLLLNPLYSLMSYPHREPGTLSLAIFGAFKALIVAGGLLVATKVQRRLLWTLVFFDVAVAALLAAGRYTTGTVGELSSRYQYISLLCFSPFLGILATRLIRSQALLIGFVAVLAAGIAFPWGRHLDRWSRERGVDVRAAIQSTPDDQRFGLPSITAGRARELIAKYNLH